MCTLKLIIVSIIILVYYLSIVQSCYRLSSVYIVVNIHSACLSCTYDMTVQFDDLLPYTIKQSGRVWCGGSVRTPFNLACETSGSVVMIKQSGSLCCGGVC